MRISRTAGVLLGALVLVGGANLAVYAANGSPFILGQTNIESKASVLKNTGTGPALKLKANGAPLAVNNSTKVKNLNADKVDGKNASQLGTKTYVYETGTISSGTATYVTFPNLPAGQYLMTYQVYVHFDDSADHALACYIWMGGIHLSTYGVGNGAGHTTCAASGVVDSSTLSYFEVAGPSAFSNGTSSSVWTFTRLNTVDDSNSPSVGHTLP